MITKTTYAKNIVRVSVKYHCICGHKYTRINSDWFTNNPFNNQSPTECRNQIREELFIKQRNCPKCKEICRPITLKSKI